MEKLIRRLRRELTRNPKQTIVLGAGLLLAGYFWAPLAANWFKPVTASRKAAGANAPTTTTPSALAETSVDNAATWQELARWMADDPLRSLAHAPNGARDPFQSASELLPQIAAAVVDDPAFAIVDETPAEPPARTWKLEGVILGGRVRAAIINGAVYRERESLASEEESADAPRSGITGADGRGVAEILAEVHADYVMLSVGDERIRLDLERPRLAPGDRIATGREKGES